MFQSARVSFGPFVTLMLVTTLAAMVSFPAAAVAGPPAAITEAATAVSYTQATLKGKVNPEGVATKYWFEYGETEAYGTKIPISPVSVGAGSEYVEVSQTPTGLAESTEYHFRIVAENEKAEKTAGKDAVFRTMGFDLSFPKEGAGSGPLSEPFGVAVDSKGNIWVSDTGNNRIVEFTSKHEYLSQFGKTGSGKGEFKKPKGITVDSSGNIWVVDSGNNRVQKFNSEGKWLLAFGKEGTGTAEFKEPSGIDVNGSSGIFVADTGNNRIEKFQSTGTWLATIGKEGTGDGELKAPQGVLIDGSGRIWVVDSGNNRVQRFINTSYKFYSKFGEAGTGDGKFNTPIGITADFQEKLWVVDAGGDRAEKFNIKGEYLDKYGKKGTGDGQLLEPNGVGVSTLEPQKLLIADSGNGRTQAWRVKAEPPVATTDPASKVEVTSATLRATINPLGLPTTYWFEYGETESYGTKIPIPAGSAGEGSSGHLIDQGITSLKEDKTYNFRVVAESAAGKSTGINRKINTLKRAITEPATAVNATEATLNGKIHPTGVATTYWFEYGETKSYGNKIPFSPESVGSGTSFVTVSKLVSGLAEGKTYHFRVVAADESGKTVCEGIDRYFTTPKLPDAVTEAPTAVKATEATLNGKVNPLGSATTYWFEYGTTKSYGTQTLPESVGSGTSLVPVSKLVSGLSGGTTYHFRIVAESKAGTVQGSDETVITLTAPKVTTEAASAINRTKATLNAKVNPEGLATTYWFEYGKTEAYGTKIPVSPESVGSGTEYVEVSQTPTGLSEGTTYHYRVVAENKEAVTINGLDRTFKTYGPPIVLTEAASGVEPTKATLNAKVNPEGLATTYWFEYGKTEAYGTKIPVSPESVGSGTEYVKVSQTPTGLSEGTTYHYRVVAENEANLGKGIDRTFKTPQAKNPPSVTTELATAISQTQATLNAQINPEGLATTYWFEYGETEGYGSKVPVTPTSVGSGAEYVEVSQEITGLGEGAEYHFRVVAENEVGTANGMDLTFRSPSFALEFGVEGGSESEFRHPADVEIDAKGNLWVVDMENNRLQKFDEEGKYLTKFGEEGSGNGQFLSPSSAAIDVEGNIWVVDTGNNRIEKFDEEGKYLTKFGEEGSGNGQFAGPEGIAIDLKGNIWVADTHNGRLQKFDGGGKFLKVVGLGHLGEPTGIDVCPGDSIWVADRQNNRITQYSDAGEFIKDFGEKGSGGGKLLAPDAIGIGSDGFIWVLDEGNSRVQEFGPGGEYISQFGVAGSGEGQFSFGRPAGIASDAKGNLWIADSLNDRVQKWVP